MVNWSNLADRVLDLGPRVQVSWDGMEFTAVRCSLRRSDVAMDEGLFASYEFSVRVGSFVFLARKPRPRLDKFTVDGRVYRVLQVEECPGGTCLVNLGGELQ